MSTSLYAARRARVAAQLGAGGIAVIPTAPERSRNRDSEFLFRHDSYFYYLSGFTEPNAWLVITADGHSTLFCQPKDLEREIWDGIRLGPDEAPAHLGVDAAYSVAELDARLPKLLENRSCRLVPVRHAPGAGDAWWTAGSTRCGPVCAMARCARRPSTTCAPSSTRCA
jgi:Xaa-Pro aminopeptidase